MNSRHSHIPVWLSLLTPPVLGGIVIIRALSQELIKIGEMSEEIFRGERLPLLNVPEKDSEKLGKNEIKS